VFHLRESVASCPCTVVSSCVCASASSGLGYCVTTLPRWHSRWQAGAAKKVCRMGCGVSHHAHDVVSATCKDKKTGIIKQLTPQQLQKLKDKQVCVTATPRSPPPPPPSPCMLLHMHLSRLLAYSRPLGRTRWLSCLLLHHKLKSVAP